MTPAVIVLLVAYTRYFQFFQDQRVFETLLCYEARKCYFSIQVQWCTEVFWLQFQVWLIYSLISCSLISYLVYYKNSFKSIFKDFVLRKLAMSWVRNVNFSQNFAYVLNKWSPVIMDVSEHHYYLLLFKNYKFAGWSKPLWISPPHKTLLTNSSTLHPTWF